MTDSESNTGDTADGENGDDGLLGWCLVANVARETAHGEAGLDVQSGTKHFPPGTKVWLPRPHWDPGHWRWHAVGHHRGSPRRYVSMVVRLDDLENFRTKGIYHERLIHYLNGWWHDPAAPTVLQKPWASREEVQEVADGLNAPMARASLDGHPDRCLHVPNPPPPEIQLDGETLHLARFNARGARYSLEPPPVEWVPGL